MPAYNSNFLTSLPASVNTNTITGATATSSVAFIETRELLVVGGEIVMAGEPFDIVEQVTGLVPLTINLELTTSAPAPITPENPSGGGVVNVPYVPGVVVESNTGGTVVVGPGAEPPPPPTTGTTSPTTTGGSGYQENVTMVETYIDAFAGPYLVAHKLSRLWSVNPDPTAKFSIFESQDGGANIVQRAVYGAAMCAFQSCTAMRASDKTYMSIQVEKKNITALPSIYLTKGVIGGAQGFTTYKWQRPNLPIAIACNGITFFVLAEGNVIYSSTDGVNWAGPFQMSSAIPTTLGTSYANGQLYSNTQYTFLQWLPGVAKWVLGVAAGGNRLHFTSAADAQYGWLAAAPFATHSGGPVAELNGNLFVTSKIDTNSPSVIWKSTDGGANWTACFTGAGIVNQFSNGLDAVLDSVNVFNGYLVAYTRSSNPKRLKSTDNGVTWSLEATNLPSTSAPKRLVLANSVVAVVNLGVGNDVYRYSTDGLNFSDSIVSTTATTGVVTPPPAGNSDPYWANVEAMSRLQMSAGVLPTSIPVQDSKGSRVVWSGYTEDVVSTADLPFLGGSTVRASVRQYATWKETNKEHVILRYDPPASGNSIPITDDFTFEQFVATDSAWDGLRFYMSGFTGIPGGAIRMWLGRNLGTIIPEIKIVTSLDGGGAPIYATPAVFDLPPPQTYFHFCVERYGNTVSVYLNGQLKASAIQSLAYDLYGTFEVGARYCAQYRATVGVARYKGPFTVPAGLFPTS